MSTYKKSLIHLKLVLLLAILGLSRSFSQDTSYTIAMADAIMERYANINDLTGKGWEYSNSIVLVGFEQVYFETGDIKYLDYIKKFVDKYVSNAGTINFNPNANNLDLLHPGLLLITLYEETGKEKYKTAASTIRNEFDNQPRNDSGGFWHKQVYPNQMWADGIYMAEPFLMRYGAIFDDLDYASDEATNQAILLANHSYDSVKHLLYHGWDDTKSAVWANPETGVSPEVWSRSMGWYCMAIVDILDHLPREHQNFNRLIEILQGLAIGIKTYQDADSSLWYQVVDKGNSPGNWIETSGSAMFIYTLKKAMRKGYLDSSFDSVANSAWTALKSRISWDEKNQPVINDFVGGMGIKSSYTEYVSQTRVSTPPSSHPHGYCGFLLAGSEMEFSHQQKYMVETSVIGSGNIIIEPDKSKIDSGTTVTLSAISDSGFIFQKWEGDIESTENPLIFQLNKNISVTASFIENISGLILVADESSVKVFPSVAGNYITIHIKNVDSKQISIEIINQEGKLLISPENFAIAGSEAVLKKDISKLPRGNYYVLVKVEKTDARIMAFAKN